MGATNGRVGDSNGHIRTVTQDEGYVLLDRLTQRYMRLSAGDFINGWHAGKYRDEDEFPEAFRLALMIRLVE